MSTPENPVDAFVDRIPPKDEIRRRLSANIREAKLLRQLMRLAEQRDKVAEVSTAQGGES